MMKTLLKFAVVIVFLISCKSDEVIPDCNFDNPLEGLAWLKEKTIELQNSTHQQIINEANYKNQTVFVFSVCCSNCNTVVTVYDCQGNKLGLVGNQEDNISSNDLKNTKEIWKSKEECL